MAEKQQNVTLTDNEKRDQKESGSLDEYCSKTSIDGGEEISSDHPGPAIQSFVSDDPVSDPAGGSLKQVSDEFIRITPSKKYAVILMKQYYPLS